MHRWARDIEPRLPFDFGPCSNGEFDPQPLTPVAREAIRRAHDASERHARRLGMSRRDFLASVCGAATTLLALNACSAEATRATKHRRPGSSFTVPPTASTDPDVARAALAGDDFVFDVQTHFLDYRAEPPSAVARDFFTNFPQQACGEGDPRACFSIERFLEELFLHSDTSMIVISGLPIAPEQSPQSAALMDEARRITEAVCDDRRVLVQAQALPNIGDLQANLDAMSAAVERSPIAAWKVFTNYPDLYDGSGNAWRLDDGDSSLAAVGDAFVGHAVSLGVPIITAHKGLSSTAGYRSDFASPVDIGPAARHHPDASFVAYHSGYEADVVEGPYDDRPAPEGTRDLGVNRLITSLRDAGVAPNTNAYAELGTTWWALLTRPDEAAHVLGKLLVHVGENNVLWGTDAVFYGSPQPLIQAFRAFQISDEFQERFGYPSLTDEIKRKVLGLNAVRLHDVDPVTVPCAFTRADIESARAALPTPFTSIGPRTRRELFTHVRDERRRLGV
jgi:hypothetical protein